MNFEKRLGEFTVSEILREEYSGLDFPGHDRIDIGFGELEALILKDRPDWRGALANAKGVYPIADGGTGRLYVGAACGEGGVWSRWREYTESGHGGNAELRKLLEDRGLDYCRRHFRFSLLETHGARIADEATHRDKSNHLRGCLTAWRQFQVSRHSPRAATIDGRPV